MAKDEGAGAGSILLAFLLGAVSGAAVALLYAPAPGRETREYLGEKAREGRQRAAEAAERAADAGASECSAAVDRLAQAVEEARALIADLLREG